MNEIREQHNFIMENRTKLTLTGVTDVDKFNENEICLFTQLGELTIRGKNLHVNEMNIENGNLIIEGDIAGAVYGDKDRRKKLSSIGKIFK